MMDQSAITSQLVEITELTTNGDHRVTAHMYIRMIDGKMPYSEPKLIRFLNESQTYIIKEDD